MSEPLGEVGTGKTRAVAVLVNRPADFSYPTLGFIVSKLKPLSLLLKSLIVVSTDSDLNKDLQLVNSGIENVSTLFYLGLSKSFFALTF